MTSAEQIYADPSVLPKLYVHQRESAAMNAWRAKQFGPLPVTHHDRIEVINGLCLAAYRGEITPDALTDALASFDEDFSLGYCRQADVLWRSALNRAADLSRSFSPKLGTRSLDVLHVASAFALGLRRFLTFDDRQQKLARAVGLKLVVP